MKCNRCGLGMHNGLQIERYNSNSRLVFICDVCNRKTRQNTTNVTVNDKDCDEHINDSADIEKNEVKNKITRILRTELR